MFVYFRKNIILAFCLGMLSGLPLALTASTLSVLLRERGVDLATIGTFAMVGLPYTFKFLWAPILDNLRIYYVSRKLGRRRAQLLLIGGMLCLSLAILGLISANAGVQYIAITAVIIAFLSASQDIIIDAMRIEMLSDSEQAAGSSSATMGYRVAMIISSAGALSAAHFLGWTLSYLSMAGVSILLLTVCVAFYKDVIAPIAYDNKLTFVEHFINIFSVPFIEIYKRTNFFHMVMFVVFFKMSDALILSLNSVFLLDVGFSKLDIAWAVKSFGMGATIIGALVGGYIATKIDLKKFVILGIILQMVSNLSYLLLVDANGNVSMLLFVTTIEYSCSGISTAALVAYISTLCNKQFTASQYSLLSAIASFARTTVAGSAGFMVEGMGWSTFFIATAFASLPSLLLVEKAFSKFNEK
jgi:PAT family beta-lactamase induction signal transducer AmpG